ncbi:MAG TPA: tRNA lysidine(34) synthetase TilS [Verrucomicrobiae bacterium]|nr:tRNA lysidine(34) synthetase TilS [Verrucomicrobiae bacterium]
MAGLAYNVERSITARALFQRGQKILVAVSGGVDSMTLLAVLCQLATKNKWQLAVAHLNHRLRGRDSIADEELVHLTTRRLGLRLVSEHADVRALAREQKISIEMAARALRHDFLARTAKRLGIATIALAHHADDQLELFFLRLLRGSGGDGLSGMKWRNPSPANAEVELVRPLLGVSKTELQKFARINRIGFREDKTNASLDIQRNRIRHELLPLLKRKYQPALAASIQRVMEIVAADADFAKETAGKWLKQKKRKNFEKLPIAVQRRVVQIQLAEADIPATFELIESLRTSSRKKIALGPQQMIWRDAQGKVAIFRPAAKFSFYGMELKVDLKKSSRAMFNGAKIEWKFEQPAGFRRPMMVDGRELFDADRIGSQIVLRHWRAGDRFHPIGMAAPVKLQDLFVNAKIPRERRAGLVVATTVRGEIFWVEKLRISEQFKLTPQTARRLKWAWRAPEGESGVAT